MDYLAEYRSKLRTPEQAVQVIKSGDWVDYGTALGMPALLDAALAARRQGVHLHDLHAHGLRWRDAFAHRAELPGRHRHLSAQPGAPDRHRVRSSESRRTFHMGARGASGVDRAPDVPGGADPRGGGAAHLAPLRKAVNGTIKKTCLQTMQTGLFG